MHCYSADTLQKILSADGMSRSICVLYKFLWIFFINIEYVMWLFIQPTKNCFWCRANFVILFVIKLKSNIQILCRQKIKSRNYFTSANNYRSNKEYLHNIKRKSFKIEATWQIFVTRRHQLLFLRTICKLIYKTLQF